MVSIGQESLVSGILIESVFAATSPSFWCGIFFEVSTARIFAASFGAHEITIRDCDSLKSAVAKGLWPVSERPAGPWLQVAKSTSAPSKPAGSKHDSARATASPPSEQSCALRTN